MRKLIIGLSMLIFSATSALAQVSIGINISLFPELVRVPAYPVYYAPRLGINFFFYDGLYWVYEGDTWYSSAWYNGPWTFVGPEFVPLFVLRIPVRYYVSPPPYFHQWSPDGPPRWDEHWGRDWEQRRSGWDRWERNAAPAPAPLPTYQQKYSGERYPAVDQQKVLHSQNYRYQPREAIAPRSDPGQATQRAPAPVQREKSGTSEERTFRQPDSPRATEKPQPRQSAPAAQADRPPRGNDDVQRPAPNQAQPRQRGPVVDDRMPQQPGPAQRERPQPNFRPDDNQPGPGSSQEPRRGQGQEKERETGQERGQGRNK